MADDCLLIPDSTTSYLKNYTCQTVLSTGELCVCYRTGAKTGQSYECHSCRGRGVKNLVQQIGPGMVQQMQVRCPDCRGEGIASLMRLLKT